MPDVIKFEYLVPDRRFPNGKRLNTIRDVSQMTNSISVDMTMRIYVENGIMDVKPL